MSDAIVFAGGRGVRLKGTIPDDTPKFLADINGRPFCELLFDQLKMLSVSHVVCVLGYLRSAITDHLETRDRDSLRFSWCVAEGSPDFLCHAAKPALDFDSPSRRYDQHRPVWVCNGDTLINMVSWKIKPDFQSFYVGDVYAGWSQVPYEFIGTHPQRGIPMQCRGFIDMGTPEGLKLLREKTRDNNTHTI